MRNMSVKRLIITIVLPIVLPMILKRLWQGR
jgi:hypothetical protein